ncbi:MAG: TRAP transporter substrate-binding protein [Faecalibacterium prausnitzii]|nr:TRAP transporter substrate-binding protein [Faecalibacterium prausnitzii]
MKVCVTRRQLLAAAGVAALGLCGCLRKEETGAQLPELILRYAENQPEDYPTTQAALAFAQLVEQQTGGRVKVVVYSGGELGAEQSVIQQMQFGGIDFARVSLSPLAGYIPELSILQLPYLYKDADQMWRVLDGSIGDEFLGMLDQMDLVGLSWFDAGVRSFYTREKVTTLEQLQKLTIRVQESDVMSGMIKDLGAKPVQLAYSQVYAALHNGQIDGAENNWPSYQTMGHYEVAPYFLQDEHTRVPEIQLASIAAMEKLEKLDPAFPEILRDCARQSARTERKLWAKRETDSEQELRRWGVEVTVPSKEEKKKFRAAVQPLYDRFEQQAEILERIRNT